MFVTYGHTVKSSILDGDFKIDLIFNKQSQFNYRCDSMSILFGDIYEPDLSTMELLMGVAILNVENNIETGITTIERDLYFKIKFESYLFNNNDNKYYDDKYFNSLNFKFPSDTHTIEHSMTKDDKPTNNFKVIKQQCNKKK